MRTPTVLHGDCLEIMPTFPADSFHACVTDPPYHLTSIVKRFGGADAAPAPHGTDGAFARASRGFMGKQWDGGDVAFRPETWVAVLRVLKPGAHLLAFGGTRGWHRMACAIEDAGFEIRDCLMWLYGTGFPKSHDAGNGWGTALKPAWEPIILARKPMIGTVAENVLEHRTGAINIDACRVPSTGSRPLRESDRRLATNTYAPGLGGSRAVGETDVGRWPANVLHDGSEEAVELFPTAPGQQGDLVGHNKPRPTKHAFGDMAAAADHLKRGDSGSAARFFYSAKADATDRAGSTHPTVKPLDLMRYLVRLVTPRRGKVLDPFAGSGSTGEAAALEGFCATLIEREAEYVADIRRRLGRVSGADTPLFARLP